MRNSKLFIKKIRIHIHYNSRSDQGAALIAYTLLVSLIAIIAIASTRSLGKQTGQTFCSSAGHLTSSRDVLASHDLYDWTLNDKPTGNDDGCVPDVQQETW